MNEGMYIGIRNYLEEIASQNKQILAEQKRTNELLAAQAKPVAKPDAFIAAVTQDVWSKPKPAGKKGK